MQIQSEYNPIGKVTSPMVNGSSVIALKYDEGIIVAADTLLAYGSLLSMFPLMHRVQRHLQA